MINSCNLKNLDAITDTTYEVEMYKNHIKMDNPIQIIFLISQYAKLRMLEFYYDYYYFEFACCYCLVVP